MKKKNIIALTAILSAVLLLAGCTQMSAPVESIPATPEVTSEENIAIANPWSETTLDAIEDNLGIDISIPKDATQTGYRELTEEKLYEIDFVYNDLGYTYRLKKTDALEDISGLYYDWTASVDTVVGDYKATDYRAETNDETVDHIIWYDDKDGITHSLSTSAKDLDGFDITAIAEMLIGIGSDDDNYYAFYAPVIDEIKGAINDGYDDEKNYKYISNGLMEKINYGEKEELLNSIGYCIEDISGDGIPELLIGDDEQVWDSDDPDEKQSYLFNVFTMKDGEIYCVLDGWSRNSYRYLGDGAFFNVGSGGAMYTTFAYYNITTDGDELICSDCFFTYDKDGGSEIGYYHNKTGVTEPEEADEMDVTEDEFWKIAEDNDFKMIDFDGIGNY